jgi:hypothetical protein
MVTVHLILDRGRNDADEHIVYVAALEAEYHDGTTLAYFDEPSDDTVKAWTEIAEKVGGKVEEHPPA